jgi:hypothetical protein
MLSIYGSVRIVTSYGLEEHVSTPGSGKEFSLTSRLYRLYCPGMMEEVKWLEPEIYTVLYLVRRLKYVELYIHFSIRFRSVVLN